MFTIKLDTDALDGAQRILALNKQLAMDEQFPDKLLSAFILHKLPASFSNLRDGSITAGVFPSPSSLVDSIEQLQPFVSTPAPVPTVNFTRGSGIFCYNCDTKGHSLKDCSKPLLDCDICGVGAGHMAKHCLAKNNKDIPSHFSEAQKQSLLRKRAAYAKKSSASANAAEAEDDDYLSFPSYS